MQRVLILIMADIETTTIDDIIAKGLSEENNTSNKTHNPLKGTVNDTEDINPEEIATLLDANELPSCITGEDLKHTEDSTEQDTSQKKVLKKRETKKKTLKKKKNAEDEITKDMNEVSKEQINAVELYKVNDEVMYVKMRVGKIVDRFDDESGSIDYTVELEENNCVISTTGTKYLIIAEGEDKKGGMVKYTKCLSGVIEKVYHNHTYMVKLSNTAVVYVNESDIMRPDDYNMFSQD